MTIKTLFIHPDGRRRLLTVEGNMSDYRIAMQYMETNEVSEMNGIPLDEAQRWYRQQGQNLVNIGFTPCDT